MPKTNVSYAIYSASLQFVRTVQSQRQISEDYPILRAAIRKAHDSGFPYFPNPGIYILPYSRLHLHESALPKSASDFADLMIADFDSDSREAVAISERFSSATALGKDTTKTLNLAAQEILENYPLWKNALLVYLGFVVDIESPSEANLSALIDNYLDVIQAIEKAEGLLLKAAGEISGIKKILSRAPQTGEKS